MKLKASPHWNNFCSTSGGLTWPTLHLWEQTCWVHAGRSWPVSSTSSIKYISGSVVILGKVTVGNKGEKILLLLETANNLSDSAWIENIWTKNNKWVSMKRTICQHYSSHHWKYKFYSCVSFMPMNILILIISWRLRKIKVVFMCFYLWLKKMYNQEAKFIHGALKSWSFYLFYSFLFRMSLQKWPMSKEVMGSGIMPQLISKLENGIFCHTDFSYLMD